MLHVEDLSLAAYKPAWDRQLEVHGKVSEGVYAEGALLLVEHKPVITIGRHPGSEKHLLATKAMLELRGVEVSETDRGGDITFHGPGQLVVYPILPLNFYGLNLHAYMRFLEDVVIDTVGAFGIAGVRSAGATGVWIEAERSGEGDGAVAAEPGKTCCIAPGAAKICAIGVKLRRWVTFHGLALNVTTDLSFFELINPCGLSRPVTSMEKILGEKTPSMAEVKRVMVAGFEKRLGEILERKREAELRAAAGAGS